MAESRIWTPRRALTSRRAAITRQAQDAAAVEVVKALVQAENLVGKASPGRPGGGPGVPPGSSWYNAGGPNNSLVARVTNNLAAAFGRPSEEVEQALADQGLNWSAPFAPGRPLDPYFGYRRPARTRDYTVGENVQITPRWGRVSFQTISSMIDACEIATIIIRHMINDVRSLDYAFMPPEGTREDVSEDLTQARKFFSMPDKRQPFRAWLAEYLQDVLRYDAGALYIRRNNAGDPIALECIDGTSINALVDFYGRTPTDENDATATPEGDFPADIVPAYVQIIQGMPWVWLTADDLIYQPWNPLPNSQYGLAPMESVLLSANIDVRFQWHWLQFFAEGSVPQGFMEAPPDLSDPAQVAEFQCYSDDTEVLTESGWKRFADVDITIDRFATRNPKTKAFEWQEATHLHEGPFSGQMCHFTGKSLDLLVTPNHRMLVTALPRLLGGNRYRKGEAFVEARDLLEVYEGRTLSGSSVAIPLCSEWDAPDIGEFRFGNDPTPDTCVNCGFGGDSGVMSNDRCRTCATYLRSHGVDRSPDLVAKAALRSNARSAQAPRKRGAVGVRGRQVTMNGDDFVAFMGAWLAEGSVTWVTQGNRRYGQVVLAQMPDSKGYAEYRTMLARIFGVEPRYTGTGWTFTFRALYDYLQQFGRSGEKFVPDEIKNASRRQLEIFLHYYWLGDGSATPSGTQRFVTKSRRMADDLQEIAQKIGRSASVRPHSVRGDGTTYWAVLCSKSATHHFRVNAREYNGDVYCVSVPNETLYVRRNGYPAWCGNSVWDDMMLGDQAKLRQIRWVPFGAKYTPTKSAVFDFNFPLYIMRRIASAFGVNLNDMGYSESTNRSTSESMIDINWRVGTMPLVRHVEDVINTFLREHLNLRAEIRFDKGQEAEDRLSLAQAHDIYIKNGTLGVDEARAEIGRPINRDRPMPRYVYTTRNGPIPLLALESLAGDTDPETFASPVGTPLVPHPFIITPGVIPEMGTPEFKADADSSANMQREMLAQASGAPTEQAGIGAAQVRPGPENAAVSDTRPMSGEEAVASKALADAMNLIEGLVARLEKGDDDEDDDEDGIQAAGIAVVALDTGRLLLQQRALKDDTKDAAGYWELPGGRLHGGETPWQAALREWGEEVGVDLLAACPDAELIGILPSDDGDYVAYVVSVTTEESLPINVRFADAAGVS